MFDYILKGRVIDGIADEALEDGAVAIENGMIVYVGPTTDLPPSAGTPEITAETILPGFIDSHAHLVGLMDAGGYADGKLFGDLLLGAAYQTGLLLDAGFTGVRDMSEQGFYLARAQERGILRSPRIMPGGRCLSITGGHGDMWPELEKEYFNLHNPITRLCDGMDDCILAAREQFRQGAKFIKVLATGGVSSPLDDVNDVQFSPEELRAIVEEAKRRQSYVTAHCTGNEGAYQALLAGVECIEHGVMLTQREIDIMAERGIPLVTTFTVALGAAEDENQPLWFIEKAKRCAEAILSTVELARESGIRFAFGTDFSNSKTTEYLLNGREFVSMVEIGFSPMEAIRAGTIEGARLMRSDDVTGSLEQGKRADIVLVSGNPLEDISCIADAAKVESVFLDGKKVK
jgi:imidazolonepropionase-like amidohydrolase